PYYLRAPRGGDLYSWPQGEAAAGLPFEPARLGAVAGVRLAGAPLDAEEEVTYRFVDKMQGELRRPVRVVPAVSLLLEPGVAVLPVEGRAGGPLRFSVRLRGGGSAPAAGTLRLDAPA